MKSLSELDEERDDATGGYNKYYLVFKDYTEEELRQKQYEGIPHTVPHVDMDAILTGREKRLTIEQSMHRGAELCVKFVREFKTHQSDKQTVEVKEKEGFTRDDTIEF